ncbi:MAG: acyltransferase family protein [Candidatus Amulumruptor caecigallinarius]|nr:acyltransferase family protein [Candidatus Amulumruptor caecigallinarius]
MRNNVISICKGIAIILMVVGHAEAPTLLTNFIYTFHMPLFFITAGYFFSRKYLDDPWEFCAKRVRGLYFPFLKWSLFFLVTHNIWFHFGILNETYGNWTGGVTHSYSAHDIAHRLVLILTSMSGYDEFMAGAFWFFRGLLVASVMFMILYKMVDSTTRFREEWCVAAVCLCALAFNAFRIGNGLKIPTIPNGGLREVWGIFFFGIGVLYRQFEPRIKEAWWLSLIYFLILCVAAKFHFCGMNNRGEMRDLLTLPLTGCTGFLLVKHISRVIDAAAGPAARLLAFVGNNTLYVFIFHIISFKLVSLVKIWWYDLPFEQIGCHMVIHYNNHEDLFWVIYSIVGVAVPLIALKLWREHSPRGKRMLAGMFAKSQGPVS